MISFRDFKRIPFLFIVVFFYHFHVLSQESSGVNVSYRDSIIKYYNSDSTKTKFFIDANIVRAEKNNDSKELFLGYHALASFYYKYNDTTSLVRYTDKLLSIAKENNLKVELLKAYHLKNNSLIMTSGLGDPKIFENIYAALKIAKEIKSNFWECKYYDDLASLYRITGDYTNALNYYSRNLSILDEISDSQDYKNFKAWGGSIEKTYLELTDIYIDIKEVDSAKVYNRIALSVLDSTEGKYHEEFYFRNKTHELEINLLEGKITKARETLKEAFNIVPKTYKKTVKDYSEYYYAGLISYYEEDFDRTIKYFEAIDTIKINIDERAGFFHNDIYKILYKAHLKKNNLKKADFYFEKHLASLQGQMAINNSVTSNFRALEISQYNEEVQTLRRERWKQRLLLVIVSVSSLFTALLIFFFFKKKRKKDKENLEMLLERISNKEIPKKVTYVPLKINDEEIKRIMERIKELENTRYYLKNECTLPNLAKKLKTNTTYLSKIFNRHFKKSFNTYLNDFRIDFIIDKLKEDTKYRRYSIQSLANEVGFKSKESFNAAFKKRTGVLPSTLIKELSKQ